MFYVLLAAVAWSAVGLLACIGFRRAGHNFWLFAGLAVWMGPFILLLMRLVSRDQQANITSVLREGRPYDGWLDVLVSIDGSRESSASVIAALRTLRPALRRVRMVAVLDHETAGSPDFFETDEELEEMLAATAAQLEDTTAELALLSGRADRALIAHAEDEDFDLLLVGHRHRRSMAALLGSTVQRLSHNANVAVLVGPPVSDVEEIDAIPQPATTAMIGE